MSQQDTLRSVLGTIPNAVCPVDGIASAGQPPKTAWGDIARAGYRTVVDLRMPDEPRDHNEPEAVRAAGMEYVAIPTSQPTLRDEIFDRFREVMSDADRRPIFVHCATANRVGALLLPYFALDEHRPMSEAVQLAQRAGLRNPELANLAVNYAQKRGAEG